MFCYESNEEEIMDLFSLRLFSLLFVNCGVLMHIGTYICKIM